MKSWFDRITKIFHKLQKQKTPDDHDCFLYETKLSWTQWQLSLLVARGYQSGFTSFICHGLLCAFAFFHVRNNLLEITRCKMLIFVFFSLDRYFCFIMYKNWINNYTHVRFITCWGSWNSCICNVQDLVTGHGMLTIEEEDGIKRFCDRLPVWNVWR